MRIATAVVVIAGLLGARAAWAGAKYTTSIYIGSGYASGGIGDVRNSASPYEYIQCDAMAYAGGYADGWCYAWDGANVAYCYTTDPTLVDMLKHVPEGSGHISFAFNSSYECTSIEVTRSSYAPPKLP
jgi:hypothetical protein